MIRIAMPGESESAARARLKAERVAFSGEDLTPSDLAEDRHNDVMAELFRNNSGLRKI